MKSNQKDVSTPPSFLAFQVSLLATLVSSSFVSEQTHNGSVSLLVALFAGIALALRHFIWGNTFLVQEFYTSRPIRPLDPIFVYGARCEDNRPRENLKDLLRDSSHWKSWSTVVLTTILLSFAFASIHNRWISESWTLSDISYFVYIPLILSAIYFGHFLLLISLSAAIVIFTLVGQRDFTGLSYFFYLLSFFYSLTFYNRCLSEMYWKSRPIEKSSLLPLNKFSAVTSLKHTYLFFMIFFAVNHLVPQTGSSKSPGKKNENEKKEQSSVAQGPPIQYSASRTIAKHIVEQRTRFSGTEYINPTVSKPVRLAAPLESGTEAELNSPENHIESTFTTSTQDPLLSKELQFLRKNLKLPDEASIGLARNLKLNAAELKAVNKLVEHLSQSKTMDPEEVIQQLETVKSQMDTPLSDAKLEHLAAELKRAKRLHTLESPAIEKLISTSQGDATSAGNTRGDTLLDKKSKSEKTKSQHGQSEKLPQVLGKVAAGANNQNFLKQMDLQKLTARVDQVIGWLMRFAILLLSTIAAFLIARLIFSATKKEQTVKRVKPPIPRALRKNAAAHFRKLRLPAKEEIIQTYNLFLELMNETVIPCPPYLPPLTYETYLADRFPSLSAETKKMTQLFCRCLYGEQKIPEIELDQFRRASQNVMKHFGLST
jgi:hypothetical protein